MRCMQASEVILTVYDKPTLRQLNAAVPPSCGWTSWKYGVPQIVSNTSGCPVLGVDVADFEADVVRVDRRHHWPLLYLGHNACFSRPTWWSKKADTRETVWVSAFWTTLYMPSFQCFMNTEKIWRSLNRLTPNVAPSPL